MFRSMSTNPRGNVRVHKKDTGVKNSRVKVVLQSSQYLSILPLLENTSHSVAGEVQYPVHVLKLRKNIIFSSFKLFAYKVRGKKKKKAHLCTQVSSRVYGIASKPIVIRTHLQCICINIYSPSTFAHALTRSFSDSLLS